jgi:blocked-early-in-transport protein 1
VVEQNKYLDGMGLDFDRADGLIGGTLKKIGTMMEQGGSKHMCYLIAFVVFIFV